MRDKMNAENMDHNQIEILKEKCKQDFEKEKLSVITNQFKRRRNKELVVERIRTGYKELDAVLGGGIPETSITGLSGAPSVGKSTFALQMAEQMTEAGNYILYFSYEMSAVQVGSKSVARKYFIKNNKQQATSISGLSLINRQFWNGMTDEQWRISEEVANEVESINNRLFFIDCTLNPFTIDEIDAMVSNWITSYERIPIVFIDYLHMIKPPLDEKGRPTMNTDKQNLDYNMRGIRSLASKYKSPVVFISALKKEDFNSTADMASLSGSSGIPYNCDIIISLQYGKLDSPSINTKFDLQFEQNRNPRRIEAVITKNRFFMVGSKIKFDYYSKFDYFDDTANVTGWTDKSEYKLDNEEDNNKNPVPSKQFETNSDAKKKAEELAKRFGIATNLDSDDTINDLNAEFSEKE